MAVDIPKSLEDLPVTKPRFIGQTVQRVEDPALLTGRTEFIDNVNVTGMIHCVGAPRIAWESRTRNSG